MKACSGPSEIPNPGHGPAGTRFLRNVPLGILREGSGNRKRNIFEIGYRNLQDLTVLVPDDGAADHWRLLAELSNRNGTGVEHMRHGQSHGLLFVVLITTFGLWTAPTTAADQGVVFATLVIGSHSGIRAHANMVARTEAQWRALWQQHATGIQPPPRRPAVNFSTEMVIAVFAGPSPARTQISVETITIKRYQLMVSVQRKFDPSNREFNLTGGPDTPYHIVRLPRSSLRVVFVTH